MPKNKDRIPDMVAAAQRAVVRDRRARPPQIKVRKGRESVIMTSNPAAMSEVPRSVAQRTAQAEARAAQASKRRVRNRAARRSRKANRKRDT